MTKKPQATPEIVADPEAYAAHQVAIEVWGLGTSFAGRRLCRWFVDMGADYDFCPAETAPSP